MIAGVVLLSFGGANGGLAVRFAAGATECFCSRRVRG